MQYGFRIIDDLCEGLRLFMQENGYKTLSDLIGIALPNIVPPEKLERTQIHRPTVDNSLCLGCGRCFVPVTTVDIKLSVSPLCANR
mgnify:CR=1 FL=1